MLSSCCPSQSSPAFTEQQLKQLRAQCLVFLAVRNNTEPTRKHMQIALGEFSTEGSSSSGGGDNHGSAADNHGETGSSPAVFSVPAAVFPPLDHPLDLSTLQLSSSPRPRRIVRRGLRKIQ